MLVTTKLAQNASVESLVKLWAARYIPDLSTLSLQTRQCTTSDLIEAASQKGRSQTVSKLRRIVEIHCKCAGIQTSVLFSYIPNVVNLTESQGIARVAGQVYEEVLEVYQQQSLTLTQAANLLEFKTIDCSTDAFGILGKLGLTSAVVDHLAISLEPALLKFQQYHLAVADRRAIGFMSTQFHLSSHLLLSRLTLAEQLLLSPYFKFIEEQVCIPWQRMCAAATEHSPDSPALALAQQLLPASTEIATTVYNKALQLFPTYRSQRGRLSDPKVKASSLRDIEMFQAYLLLCVLEQSMAVVEQELHPLCVMVYPAVEVKWNLVEKMLELLINEIFARVKPEYKSVLQPYSSQMQQLFSNAQMNSSVIDRLAR